MDSEKSAGWRPRRAENIVPIQVQVQRQKTDTLAQRQSDREKELFLIQPFILFRFKGTE